MTKKLLLLNVLFSLFACAPIASESSLEEYRLSLRQIDNGTISLRQGELDKAQAAFRVAADLHASAAAYDGLGCVAFQRGELDLAEQYFWKAYYMDTQYDHVLGNLAELYQKKQDYTRARAFYEAAIERNPAAYRFRNNYAVHLMESGHLMGSVPDGTRGQPLEELRKAGALSDDGLVHQNIVLLEEMRGHGDGGIRE